MMNCKPIKCFLAAILFAAVIGSPMALWGWQNGPDTGESHFIKRLDKDGDGRVSAAEFASGTEAKFSRLDANGDGYLDASETPRRPRHGAQHCKMKMTGLDTDGDGQISATEFPGPADHFVKLDADGDGFLSDQEMRAAGPCPKGDRFKKDDADQDGRVSREEFGGPADLFDRLDTDGDGFITQAEARPGCRNPAQACPFRTK